MVNVCTNLDINFHEQIGAIEGKNSQVFRATDPQLNQQLVVKIIPKKDFLEQNQYFQEAQMLYMVKHPNIMEIQYASSDDENIYFSMPFYENGSLDKEMNTRQLSLKEIIKYSLDFLTGLHYIHVKGLLHLDIKPTNLLINNSNKLVITDFGLSKYIDEHGFAEQNVFYSSHRPPETLKSNIVSIESDIYQAGLTLYRMCNEKDCLKNQFKELNIKNKDEFVDIILNSKFPDRKKYLNNIPKSFIKIINKAMSVESTDRYSSALDMMNDISKLKID